MVVAELSDRRARVRRPGPALFALAAAAFVFVTSETMPVGLLPQIGAGLHVSDGRVGLLMTLYAVVAALTAIPFTAWTTHLPRRRLITALVVVFALAQFAAALAPSYWWLVAARLLCALAHGVFWSVVAPAAARLAPGASGRATTAVFVGTSLALVLGSPATTAVGQLVGWRAAFLIVGAVGVVTVTALRLLLPDLPGDAAAGRLRTLGPALFGSRRLRSLYAVTLVVVIGHFAAFTYLAPLAARFGGITGSGYSLLLFGYGAAGLLALLLTGRHVDRAPLATFAVPTAVVALSLAGLALAGHGPAVTAAAVVLWGGAFSVLPAALQSSVLRVAPADADTVSAVYVVAFQIGIGAGALVGGVFADGGRLGALPLLAAACAAAALLVGARSRTLFPARG